MLDVSNSRTEQHVCNIPYGRALPSETPRDTYPAIAGSVDMPRVMGIRGAEREDTISHIALMLDTELDLPGGRGLVHTQCAVETLPRPCPADRQGQTRRAGLGTPRLRQRLDLPRFRGQLMAFASVLMIGESR